MSVSILVGDVFEKLAELPTDHFDCVVTSPPYWGLRKYIKPGAPEEKHEIGLEPTMAEHLDVMVRVFREIRRVLKPSGTFWLNYGDAYAGSWGAQSRDHAGKHGPNVSALSANQVKAAQNRRGTGSIARTPGLKPKDLLMLPNRLAILLQDDGWWIRSEIIWGKTNPMPESVTDRPATAHEKIWLLSKSGRYFYALDDVRQTASAASVARWAQDVEGQEGSHRGNGGAKTNGTMKAVGGPRRKQDAAAAAAAAAGGSSGRRMDGFNARWDAAEKRRLGENANGFRGGSYVGGEPSARQAKGNVVGDGSRNLRNYEPAPLTVWPMASVPFKEAHFATFPPELAARALRAGCPAGGHVLDPFGGAGTVGLVAESMGLDCTLIELSPGYAEMAALRIKSAKPCSQVEGVALKPADSPLFGSGA